MPGHGNTTVRDGPTQGGSALRKLPQLLLWDLPEPGWLLVLATLAWHGTATPWPQHGQALTPMCPPWCTGVPQGHLARLVAGTRKRQTFTGMQLFPGPTAAGTQPAGQGLGDCTGWGSSLYFSKLFIPLQRPPDGGYLQHVCHSQGHKQKLQSKASLIWTLHTRPPAPAC